MTERANKYSRILFIILAVGAFFYVAARAYLIGITHDEAYSVYLADTNYFNALVSTANTHWLNSFFIKLFVVIIGSEPLSIRLHSVLAFLVFAYFLYRFFIELKSVGAGIILIALFFLNRFSLEYFSLARGYGICLAFLVASIFFAYKTLTEKTISFKHQLYSLIFGILAVASNYTALIQFCGIFTFLIISIYLKSGKLDILKQRKYIHLFILFFGTCVVAITNLLIIKFFSNDLQFGGDISFFTNTLDSIINYIAYPNDSLVQLKVISTSSLLLFCFLLAVFIYGIVKRDIKIIFFSTLFFFQVFINYLLFFLFDTPFPYLRTALVLFPAIAFSIVWFFESINLKAYYKIIVGITVLVASGFLLFRTFSLNSAYEWRKQSEIEYALNYLNQDISNNHIDSPKILVCGNMYSLWKNYYNHFYPEKYIHKLALIHNYYLPLEVSQYQSFDYLVSARELDSNLSENNDEFILLKRYPQSHLSIYKICINN
ncbi:hypothetical protein ACFLQ5_00730 [Bacteroidota bacterium]